jgi:hypothetical protein
MIMRILCLLFITLFVTTANNVEGQGARGGAGLGNWPTDNSGTRSGLQRGQKGPTPIVPVTGSRQLDDGTWRIEGQIPLRIAAELLQRKFGVPISYEDPVWSFAGDIANSADLAENRAVAAKDPNWKGRLFPRPGILDLTLPGNASAIKRDEMIEIIQTALKIHVTNHNPGEFKLVEFGDHELAIVADRAANSSGKMVKQVLPLDRIISLPEQERSLNDTLDIILRPLNVTPIVQFRDPNLPRVTIGAQNEIARNVLSKALRHPGMGKLGWILLYDPQAKSYIFRINGVQAETPQGLRSVYWPRQN